MEIAQLKRILEGALFASTHPLSFEQLTQLFAEDNAPTHDELAQALLELQAGNAERGVELIEVASGYRYQVQHDVYPWVSRLWTERQSRYSRALLETLALIAYRQPITRGEIEQIRGVVVSTNIIRTLEEREWVRVVGHRDMPGRPALYGTTKQFLDYFNLKSLDQLPALSEIRDLSELEPQLEFDGPRIRVAAQTAELDGIESHSPNEVERPSESLIDSEDDDINTAVENSISQNQNTLDDKAVLSDDVDVKSNNEENA